MIETVTELVSWASPFDAPPEPITTAPGQVAGGAAIIFILVVILGSIIIPSLAPLWSKREYPLIERMAGPSTILLWFVALPVGVGGLVNLPAIWAIFAVLLLIGTLWLHLTSIRHELDRRRRGGPQ